MSTCQICNIIWEPADGAVTDSIQRFVYFPQHVFPSWGKYHFIVRAVGLFAARGWTHLFSWPKSAKLEVCLDWKPRFSWGKCMMPVLHYFSEASSWQEWCVLCTRKELDILLSDNPTLRVTEMFTNSRPEGNKRLWLVMTCFVSTASILIDSNRDAYVECPLGICRDHLSRRTSSTIHPSWTWQMLLTCVMEDGGAYSSCLELWGILRKLTIYPCSL